MLGSEKDMGPEMTINKIESMPHEFHSHNGCNGHCHQLT